MGSGKFLRRAIKKYGKEIFVKEILEIYSSEREMNLAERILVVVDKEVSYNLCAGGHGGFSYINENKLQNTEKALLVRRENGRRTPIHIRHWEKMRNDPIYYEMIINKLKNQPPNKSFLGKKHTEKTKQQMRLSAKGKRDGEKNGKFGTCWITNGVDNKCIKKDDVIPDGWKRGRKMK